MSRFARKPVEAPKPVTWIQLEPSKNKQKRTQSQIVQTEKMQKQDQAPDNAYLGEQNQKVDKQSITINKGQQSKAAKSMAQAGASQSKALPHDPRIDLSLLGVPMFRIPPPEREIRPSDAALKEQQQAETFSYGPKEHEYVKGISEGQRTLLNTKEFAYYGYFQRIRERLEIHWGSTLREQITRMQGSGRGIAGNSEHTTEIVVILNKEGEIVQVKVMGESGVRDLDDAAVRAFNRAGPFPNPPKGIIDPDGTVTIAWNFVLRT